MQVNILDSCSTKVQHPQTPLVFFHLTPISLFLQKKVATRTYLNLLPSDENDFLYALIKEKHYRQFYFNGEINSCTAFMARDFVSGRF